MGFPCGRRRLFLALVGALSASGCTRALHAPPVVVAREAPALAGARWRIDPANSALRVYVYRGGTLAALGHNHVLAARGLHGQFALPADEHGVSGELGFRVDALSVDDPLERAAAGADFPGAIEASDIAGTRRNLLGPSVLDAGHWPDVRIELAGASGGPADYRIAATLVVRGVSSTSEVPVHVVRDGRRCTIDGDVVLSQARLGLEPFSVMFGALRVEDGLRVRLHLVASPQE